MIAARFHKLSSFISGHYRIKSQKLELDAERKKRAQTHFLTHRAEVIEKYITSAGSVIQAFTLELLADFGSAEGEIHLYVDEEHWPLLDALGDGIRRCDSINLHEKFIKLCVALSYENVRKEQGWKL